MNHLIYLAEDDDSIREIILICLKSEGYQTKHFSNANSLLDELKLNKPNLILMDIMMPGINGLDALKVIKENSDIPVILITAKTQELDKVKGFELGADDYITKPFGLLELRARVKNQLKKLPKQDLVTYKDLVINLSQRTIKKGETNLDFTAKELELLVFLIENINTVVTREAIINKVWGYDFIGESRTLDVHIKTIRQKLGCDSKNPTYLKTVRSIGYMAFN